MWHERRTEKTDHERYLESELERYQQAEEERQRRQEQEREERRREREERAASYQRTAGNWPEALEKQVRMYRQERREEVAFMAEYPEDTQLAVEYAPENSYFGQGVEACERGLDIWTEEASRVREQIEALEKQIAELRDGIRLAVAARLEEERETAGWLAVAEAIREYDEDNVSVWLDW